MVYSKTMIGDLPVKLAFENGYGSLEVGATKYCPSDKWRRVLASDQVHEALAPFTQCQLISLLLRLVANADEVVE